LICCR